MPQDSQSIALREAEQLVDALNRAFESEGGDPLKDFVLRFVQQFLKRDTPCHVMLFTDLDRDPAPQVLRRYVLAVHDTPLNADARLQEMVDDVVPTVRLHVPKLLRRPREATTVIFSRDVDDEQWFEDVFRRKYLDPVGYADTMLATWAPTLERAIAIIIHRRSSEPPFTEDDRTRMSLLIRAVAPLIDRELLAPAAEVVGLDLTDRQREVLAHLLSGESMKEIAARLHRSLNTVQTHVRQVYERFDVSSRGQLMAMFINKAALREAQERIGRPPTSEQQARE